MTDLVVFVEEDSARIVVETVAARLRPGKDVKVVPHEGKRDLVASFPRKIRAWRHPPSVPFLVLHDNDGSDCKSLKPSLASLVPVDRISRTSIRIVMQSLEAWYLGDEQALVLAGLITPARAKRLANEAKFRDPDKLNNAKQEFLRLHGEVGQMRLARLIAPHMNIETSRSRSYQHLLSALRRTLA